MELPMTDRVERNKKTGGEEPSTEFVTRDSVGQIQAYITIGVGVPLQCCRRARRREFEDVTFGASDQVVAPKSRSCWGGRHDLQGQHRRK